MGRACACAQDWRVRDIESVPILRSRDIGAWQAYLSPPAWPERVVGSCVPFCASARLLGPTDPPRPPLAWAQHRRAHGGIWRPTT
eukprot:7391831-Prymnesium_polylepis.2